MCFNFISVEFFACLKYIFLRLLLRILSFLLMTRKRKTLHIWLFIFIFLVAVNNKTLAENLVVEDVSPSSDLPEKINSLPNIATPDVNLPADLTIVPDVVPVNPLDSSVPVAPLPDTIVVDPPIVDQPPVPTVPPLEMPIEKPADPVVSPVDPVPTDPNTKPIDPPIDLTPLDPGAIDLRPLDPGSLDPKPVDGSQPIDPLLPTDPASSKDPNKDLPPPIIDKTVPLEPLIEKPVPQDTPLPDKSLEKDKLLKIAVDDTVQLVVVPPPVVPPPEDPIKLDPDAKHFCAFQDFQMNISPGETKSVPMFIKKTFSHSFFGFKIGSLPGGVHIAFNFGENSDPHFLSGRDGDGIVMGSVAPFLSKILSGQLFFDGSALKQKDIPGKPEKDENPADDAVDQNSILAHQISISADPDAQKGSFSISIIYSERDSEIPSSDAISDSDSNTICQFNLVVK